MREKSMNRMRKKMWEGTHFEERIGGNGKVMNVNL
jgi:hypothetical protein